MSVSLRGKDFLVGFSIIASVNFHNLLNCMSVYKSVGKFLEVFLSAFCQRIFLPVSSYCFIIFFVVGWVLFVFFKERKLKGKKIYLTKLRNITKSRKRWCWSSWEYIGAVKVTVLICFLIKELTLYSFGCPFTVCVSFCLSVSDRLNLYLVMSLW